MHHSREQVSRGNLPVTNSPNEHLLCLKRLNLRRDVAQQVDEPWTEFFVPLGDKKQPRGEFGQVMLVKATDKANNGSTVRAGETYALKLLFRKPDAVERERIELLLQLHQWTPRKHKYPRSLLRYITAYHFVSPVPAQKNTVVDAILLEAVLGKSLEAQIQQWLAVVPLDQWLFWMVDVLRALAYLHQMGVAHRDVKSGNVMIRDNAVEAVLIDLDLMCLPSSHSDDCRALCRAGKRSMFAVSPDIICAGVAGSPWPEHAEQYFRMDVWSCASLFVSYLVHQDHFLPLTLHYERDKKQWRQCPLGRKLQQSDAIIEAALQEAFSVATVYGNEVPSDAQTLLRTMLHAEWQRRPSARQCLELIGKMNPALIQLTTGHQRELYLKQKYQITPKEAMQRARTIAPSPPMTPEEEAQIMAGYIDEANESDIEPYKVT